MDVVVWLRSLGLGRYEAAFRDNEINDTRGIKGRTERMAELAQERMRWRVPWRTVSGGTEHEASDLEHNEILALELFEGIGLDPVTAAALSTRNWQGRAARLVEITDDMMVAIDQLGWKVVPRDPLSPYRWPMAAHHDLCPDWCISAEEWEASPPGDAPLRPTLRLSARSEDAGRSV